MTFGISAGNCQACGCERLTRRFDYLKCVSCGHEILAASIGQTLINNDRMTVEAVMRFDLLERFKRRTLLRWIGDRSIRALLDFGSASGKFLHHSQSLADHVAGIEIAPDATRFSRDVLGLEIYPSLEAARGQFDVITAWHSLEHVPGAELPAVLEGIVGHLGSGGRLVLSVPNADSLQMWLYGREYAFYDVPNHQCQFTQRSLDLILARVGLSRCDSVMSTEYIVFGHLQGFLNLLSGDHNYAYYRLKRESIEPRLLADVASALLLAIYALPAVLLSLLETLVPAKRGVITACYKKTSC